MRTIANRYIKSKQYNDAIDLLYQGASSLAKYKEYASSSDLIFYLLQTFEEADITSQDNDYKSKLIEILSQYPDSEATLVDLAKRVVEWSQSDANKFGDNDLHTFFGLKFLNYLKTGDESKTAEEKTKLFAITELHLILGTHDSLPIYVDYLFQWYQSSKKEDSGVDAGIFLSRAVFNYLYLKNYKFANEASELFVTKLIAEGVPTESVTEGELTVHHFASHAVVNFLQLLLLTIAKNDASSKFAKLYGEYKALLTQKELIQPVNYLAKLYFGLNYGGGNNQGNMLANLMGDLFK